MKWSLGCASATKYQMRAPTWSVQPVPTLDTGVEHIVARKQSSSITMLQLVALPARAVPVPGPHFPISAHIMVCRALTGRSK